MRFSILVGALVLCSWAAQGQSVTVVSWNELETYLNTESDKVRVVNFWATWCGPCVKELPYFQAVHDELSENVEIVLVSLDDVELVESKVQPLVERTGLSARVLLLDETDYNMFIPRVDNRWSGAIPMTIILDDDSNNRIFLERELSREELFETIEDIID